MTTDATEQLMATVVKACETDSPLWVRGGNSKAFYGNPCPVDCHELDASCHSGIINYVPEELVMHVRAGTPLAEVNALLAAEGQMLGFEPPDFGGAATIGGVVAAGLSGPRRPYAGSVRDYVLGVTLLTGHGTVLAFGGQVMKNVAGYDVSRLMVGALGTLGVILDVSFKVLPCPAPEQTLCLPSNEFRRQAEGLSLAVLGLSATASLGSNTYVRVREDSGLQGDVVSNTFWDQIANHQLPELQQGEELWRISVPASSQQFEDAAATEWGGALRWVIDPEDHPHRVLQAGHATLFRTSNDNEQERFHSLDPVLSRIHDNLKTHFDPHGIFNPNRLTWHANQNTS